MSDPVLESAFRRLVEVHRCHTVILYGSRSRGDFTDESDYDLVGFRDEGERFSDSYVLEGRFVDAWIYPTREVPGRELEFLRLRKGTILREKEGIGNRLLGALDQIFAKGPAALTDDKRNTLRVWIEKTLSRVERGDLESWYRRAWLQTDLLEAYFSLRTLWYLGPKEAFRWLQENDAEADSLFREALKPGSDLLALRRLAEKVLHATSD